MTRWSDDEQSQHAPKTRSLGADLVSFGPASTMGRELFAAAWQIVAVALLCFVIFPDRLPELARWGLLIVAVVYFAVRFLAGLPRWRHR